MLDDWSNCSAADLGRGIASGKINPVELTQYFLEKIANHPNGDEIFCVQTAQRAVLESLASRGRQKSGTLRGPLDGVPVSWKDLYDTQGDLTQSGSELLAGRVPVEDAQVVEFASEAGMICIGKTHQTELAFSGLGINPNTATPPNLDFENCAPGGSSSGAGASVSHGLSPIAVGSDTGGSVRIPSCWNSLVGLKTTHGKISTKGVVPLCSGFDTVGPLAKTVEDTGLMYEILSGESIEFENVPAASTLKIAVVGGTPMQNCDGEVLEAFDVVVSRLAQAGVNMIEQHFPEIDQAIDIAGPAFTFEAWREWGAVIEANPNVMYPAVEGRFRGGVDVSEDQYHATMAQLENLRKSFWQNCQHYDGVLMPTTPMLPPLIEPLLADHDLFSNTNILALRNTRVVNLLGGCALTLPTHAKGIGLQLMTKPNSDAELVLKGLALENIVAG